MMMNLLWASRLLFKQNKIEQKQNKTKTKQNKYTFPAETFLSTFANISKTGENNGERWFKLLNHYSLISFRIVFMSKRAAKNV